MKAVIVPPHAASAIPDADIPTVDLDVGESAPRRLRRDAEFFLVRREGMSALGAALDWHGPSMMAVMEAVRLVTMGRSGGMRLSWAWAQEVGITRRQLRTIRQTLSAAPGWVVVTVDGRGAATIRPTATARSAMEYRRN